MIKDVLVCLEGSPSTEAATRVAREIVRSQHAPLVGLAIVDEARIRAGAATGIGGTSFKRERDDALLAEARRHAGEWLGIFDKRCLQAHVVAETRQIVGKAAESIVREMQTCDLTVMGRDANFHVETVDLDPETRSSILHRSQRPTILVPTSGHATWKTAMIAYDGSSASKRAVASFADSGLAHGLDLHVTTVDDDGATAWEMANRAVEELRRRGLAAEAHNIVSVLTIPEAILKQAQKLSADVLVLGAYAGSRLRERVWGSVTTDLIDQTPINLYLQH
jgi:nucleotide-binding universal stress UspA family protein